MRHSAIIYQIEIMGEATKRVSQQFREQYPQVIWRKLAGVRDVIIHQYDRIDI